MQLSSGITRQGMSAARDSINQANQARASLHASCPRIAAMIITVVSSIIADTIDQWIKETQNKSSPWRIVTCSETP